MSSNVPGAHATYQNIQDFYYPSKPTVAPVGEDLRKWVIDGPAGLAGNPNVVPFDQRCTLAQFNTTIDPGSDGIPPFFNACPATSKVGVAGLLLGLDSSDADFDGNGAAPSINYFGTVGLGTEFLTFPASQLNATPGTIYLLQTTPEVPTTLATFFHLNAGRTKSVLAPVTSGPDGDFRIRTIPADDIVVPAGVHIKEILQQLNANAGNGEPWLTNPTRCSAWDTYSYATGYVSNTTADSAPVSGDGTVYKKATATPVTPDCSTVPPLNAAATASLSTNTRDSNPQLDVTVTNPTAPGTDLPKSITATLPASVTTDLQSPALLAGNLCETDQAAAGTCPAASAVGSATIETPFITAGLTGVVYAVRNSVAGRVVPDLLIDVAGAGNAINFRLLGNSTFVNTDQIQTTFDNLPQTAFTKFTVSIAGGKDSLLTISKCPADGSSPKDGPILYTINGYSTGNVVTSSTATAFYGCYGKPKVKSIKKCIKFNLKTNPTNLIDKANIAKVELYVGTKSKKVTKRIVKDTKSPFKFNKRISSKFKKGKKFYFRVKSTYKPTVDAPKGKQIYSNTAKGKRCK